MSSRSRMRRIDYAHDRPTDAELNLISAVKGYGAGDALTVDQCAVEALQIGNRELFARLANFGVASRDDGRVRIDHNFAFGIAAQTRDFLIQVNALCLLRAGVDQCKIRGRRLWRWRGFWWWGLRDWRRSRARGYVFRLVNSLHAAKFRRLRSDVRRSSLFNADDAQDWATGAQLHIPADAHFDRRSDLLPVNESAKARVAVGNQATAFAQAELSMFARDHRPLLRRKEVVTLGRIAADAHNLAGERAFADQLAAAIFCENYF